ncbi:SMP-30/gluconolactonase/LRE family protein [Acuticoccus sp. M5D2P5]|uniref:SMP-30/gluconolactonase/LRE family protein n=1 Tax=Acuticoccus kalidii TaxID=2910977 RepID=UPI001F3346DB|nr:SMP-30/gluconolactonase/LRE family protein [Acuticoccus kalidii]MCF3933409.1 SMP-30/gluconolactonase/LRE family protein [Acuticoccus kalidii]
MLYQIDPAGLSIIGTDLCRPECVVAMPDGDVVTCDWRGGLMRIVPDGSQHFVGTMHAPGAGPLRPNGITPMPDGSFLAANLADAGGVWRISADGEVAPFITEVDGAPIPPANFVTRDALGRIWITVSTRLADRTRANHAGADDGFIILADERGARIVANGFCFTNEVCLDPSGDWLYVNETFGRRTSRMRIGADGSVGQPEVFATYGPGIFPDGMAFDSECGLWVTSVISNSLVRVSADGTCTTVLTDPDPEIDTIEADYLAGRLGEKGHLARSRGRHIGNLSSLAFGGPDLKTIYLGCLNGNSIAVLRSPVSGHPLPHWT